MLSTLMLTIERNEKLDIDSLLFVRLIIELENAFNINLKILA